MKLGIQLAGKKLIIASGLIVMFAVILASLSFVNTPITGSVIGANGYSQYDYNVIASSAVYPFSTEISGRLQSFKIDGIVTKEGAARVFLIANGRKYMVFGSGLLKGSNTGSSSNAFTGFAVGQSDDAAGKSSTEKKSTDNLAGLSDLSLAFGYGDSEEFDIDNNGEEPLTGIVDIKIGLKDFKGDESRLCSKWELYSSEKGVPLSFCNGNSKCCAALETPFGSENWSQEYYAAYNRDGLGYENSIYAQVFYFEPESDLILSESKNLDVRFSYPQETKFKDACIESCAMNESPNSDFLLQFEIEGNAILRLKGFSYEIKEQGLNTAPVLLENFSDINFSTGKEFGINLKEYFADNENDILSYSYYDVDGASIVIDGDKATIHADHNLEVPVFTYFIANDSQEFAISNIFKISSH